MKKQVLRFALVATVIGSVAAGCSSTNEATNTDSVSTKTVTTDSTKTMSTPDTAKMVDTTKKM